MHDLDSGGVGEVPLTNLIWDDLERKELRVSGLDSWVDVGATAEKETPRWGARWQACSVRTY